MPDPSLLQRLKDSKLVQWALAYLAGAFVLFQLLDALETPLALTATVQRSILVIVGIGFFITLILAWYHGEKGRQWVSGPELLMVAALLVVAGVALSTLGPNGEAVPISGSVPSSSEEDEKPSILVLACANISPDPDDAYVADGIHEAILHRLAKVSGLQSLGRETARWYRDNPGMPSQIAAARGLDFVGECSVRKDPYGNRILVTFQLLDAEGMHAWSEEYDRDLTTQALFDIQADIAQRVAHAMQAVLAPEEEMRIATAPTDQLQAYNAYLLGRYWWNRRTPEGLRRAIDHFQEAIAQDSSYALAFAGLADSYALLPPYAAANVSYFAAAVAAAEKALELNPELGNAHASLGFVRIQTFDWEGGLREYRRAIDLEPAYATAHQWYAQALSWMGRSEEALARAQEALKLDPLSAIANRNLGEILMWARQYAAAESQLRKTLELHPDFAWTWLLLGDALIHMDRFAEAAQAYGRHIEVNGGDPELAPLFVDLVAEHERTGRPVALPPELDIEANLLPGEPGRPAVLYAMLGEKEKALEWLERAYEERSMSLIGFNVNPVYDPIRDDPRFTALLEKTGLAR